MSTPAVATHHIGEPHIPAVDEHDIDSLLKQNPDVLVWFTTVGCPPCHQLAPHLDEFADAYSTALVTVAVDGSNSPMLGRRWQIRAFPTLVFFHHGARVWQRVGASEKSAAEVEAVIAPVLRGARALSESSDVSPKPATKQPARRVTVPNAAPAQVEAWVQTRDDADSDERLEPGEHELPAGAELTVRMRADHRLRPPLDLDILDGFADDSIDNLEIAGLATSLTELAAHPSLGRLVDLTLTTGRVDETDSAALPRLTSLDVSHAWPAPALPSTLVNGSWSHPGLRSNQNQSDISAAALPGTAESHLSDHTRFDAEARHGVVFAVFTVPHSEADVALAALLSCTKLTSAAPVITVHAHRYPALNDEYGVVANPTLLILRDGRVVWRTESVPDDSWLDREMLPALQAAQRREGRVLAVSPARPPRVLDLRARPKSYDLALIPSTLGWLASTVVDVEGRIAVPAGWRVALRCQDADDDWGVDWSELDTFGPDDIDDFECAHSRGDADDLCAALSKLHGIRALTVTSGDPRSLVAPLTELLRHLPQLRSFTLRSFDGSGDVPNLAERLTSVQHTVLPHVVVNGDWSGFVEPPSAENGRS